ncbi:LysE family translocator [Telmatospirillum sp. J64-1]|uniref:LysE family translocator n=1 Tax=Telmatospirillum sp. J64-1 TaxID=2502183 RepID=UPI00115D5DFB|nr:LysE family transporter [Telmatospirillum sp. J64-1]
MGFLTLPTGMLIGLAIAAPVGPVGILCIRRALADGRFAAFVAGLGAAVADTFYGAVAAFGLSFISDWLMEWERSLCLVGGLFLLGLGVRTWFTPCALSDTPLSGAGLVKDFFATLVITLTNPGTILAFLGIFAALGGVGVSGPGEAWLLVLGVFLGSTLWWMALSFSVTALRNRFSERWLTKLNHYSALGLGLFGLVLLVSLLF